MNFLPAVNIAAVEIREMLALDIEQKITFPIYRREKEERGGNNREKRAAWRARI